jgi:LysR family transcriptional regulator, regulator of abg operon
MIIRSDMAATEYSPCKACSPPFNHSNTVEVMPQLRPPRCLPPHRNLTYQLQTCANNEKILTIDTQKLSHNMLDQITHLFRLQAIFEEGSLRRAAERLNLTQPALSRSLAQLEKYFGRPLLERHARGVHPTPFGEQVLSEALRMQRHWTVAEEALRDGAYTGHSVLRIGAGPVWRAVVVPEIILALQKDFPWMSFELKNSRFSHSLTDLKEGRIDVLFTGAPMGDGSENRLKVHPFGVVVDNIVAREQHPIFDTVQADGMVPTERLLDYPWVIYNEIPTYQETARNALFEKLGQEPNIALVCESLLSAMTVLQRGDFLSILPDAAAAAVSAPSLMSVPVNMRRRQTTGNFVYREEMQDWPPLKALVEKAAALSTQAKPAASDTVS